MTWGAGLAGLGFALCAIIPGAYVLARTFRRVSTALGVYFTLGGLGGVVGPVALLPRQGVAPAAGAATGGSWRWRRWRSA